MCIDQYVVIVKMSNPFPLTIRQSYIGQYKEYTQSVRFLTFSNLESTSKTHNIMRINSLFDSLQPLHIVPINPARRRIIQHIIRIQRYILDRLPILDRDSRNLVRTCTDAVQEVRVHIAGGPGVEQAQREDRGLAGRRVRGGLWVDGQDVGEE